MIKCLALKGMRRTNNDTEHKYLKQTAILSKGINEA